MKMNGHHPEDAHETVIETQNLTKRYGDLVAVKGLNLKVKRGEIFGLLGPNGAGKTTTILMLLGLTEPTGGSARVLGHDPTREVLEVKGLVGYMPEDVGYYEDLTGRENLMYTADLNGLPRQEAAARVERLLSQVGLAEVADKRVEHYSHGMRQRLGLADVLVKDPEIIILDEPTQGIDPQGAQDLLKFIVRLSRERQMTVLISSHLLDQMQRICDRVAIFVRGEVIAEGPIDTLGRQIMRGESLVVEVEVAARDGGTRSSREIVESLQDLPGVQKVEPSGGNHFLVHCSVDVRDRIATQLVEKGLSLTHLRLRGYGLTDIYMRYFRGGESDG